MKKRRALPVNFKGHLWDKKVIEMTKKGFFAHVIAVETSLSVGQVRYRQHARGVSANGYRRGETPEAKRVKHQLDHMIGRAADMRRQIERMYGRAMN